MKDFEKQIAEFIIIKSIEKPSKKLTASKIQNKPKNTLQKDVIKPSIKRTRSKIQSQPKNTLEKGVAKPSKKHTSSKNQIKPKKGSKQKVFQCDICNKNLANKSSLGQHRRDKHSGIWYFCDDCSTDKQSKEGRFRYVYNLQTHVRNKHQRELKDTEEIPQNSLIEETKRK